MTDDIKEYIDLSVSRILERKRKEATKPDFYYHGTLVDNVNSILQSGMLAEPPSRKWSKETSIEQSNINNRSLQSLKGSYWTKDIRTANYSVESVNKTFVVAQISPKESLPDEDNVSSFLERDVDDAINNADSTLYENIFQKYLSIILVDSALSKAKNYFVKYSLPKYQTTQNQPVKQDLLDDLFESFIGRKLAHYIKNNQNKMWDIFIKAISKIKNYKPPSTQEEGTKLYEDIIGKYSNIADWENRFSNVLDKFTNYYKKSILDTSTSADYQNVRVPKDLGYTNRSRIVLIVVKQEPEYSYSNHNPQSDSKLYIRYKDPYLGEQALQKFLEDYRRHISKNFIVM